jgi:hypothetical protein
VALGRPISLKNESIGVIRRFAPDAVFGPPSEGSAKGTTVLVRPPPATFERIDAAARPRWIVFPRYQAGAALKLTERPKAPTFIELGNNAMNYNILGERGFDATADLIDRCDVGDFVYSDLEEAVRFFTAIADAASQEASMRPFYAAGP